jgi:peptidyl-prolyl cis-trans isomerase SurA
LGRNRQFAVALAVGLWCALAALPAGATIVERVVAVIGERPLLWTDLLKRSAASRIQIRTQTRDPNIVSVQEQEMFKELLQRMIDDRLVEQQADKARIGVTPEEIDRGIANIAAQAQSQQGRPVTVQDVFGEVRHRGMTEQDFRDEIRRQILEGKLIELRVRPRVRVTDQDALAAYRHWTQETTDQQPVETRIIALRILPQSTRPQYDGRMALAREVVDRARAGEDFCTLVSQYTDDVSTRDVCGSHGAQPVANLVPAIQDVVRTMKSGEVSEPIPVRIGQDEVLVIVMLVAQAHVAPYEEVKNEMMQRALMEGLERGRKLWLQELRHNMYIDVRL